MQQTNSQEVRCLLLACMQTWPMHRMGVHALHKRMRAIGSPLCLYSGGTDGVHVRQKMYVVAQAPTREDMGFSTFSRVT